ncbi:ECF RNA polymerase sigma factor SigE [Thalassoglobus neptunius]|uniref:ECF RNA polymerase sigma factor SigE n=1 Tax=Thalassoglobus neptunius TaxID=1938619 RepID=A0A5C5UYN5_9PLAN|nr:sigma-70 family RNA polymerase sigma factor [Thalassoglobus neptunius]TWT30565.1 ECF RNA polymerase sigma factor SigE [Thalassoglobus neptunius]
MHGPDTRASLIEQLADSNCQPAWDEFVRLYQPAIYRVACNRGLQHADAEDLTQDVLTQIGCKVKDFDVSGSGSFRGWLGKITRDMLVDGLRRRQRAVDVASGDSGVRGQLAELPSRDETGTLIQIEVRREQLMSACERIRFQFSEPVWLSFWLTAIEQQSIAKVAEQLNRSEGSVRVARCRVMNRLKEEVRNNDSSASL